MDLQATLTELSRQREEAKGQITAAKEKIRTLGLKIRKMETLMKNANEILNPEEVDIIPEVDKDRLQKIES